MTDSQKNQKLVYQEACLARQTQQASIDHINTKLSWVIAANIVLLGLVSFASQQEWHYIGAGMFWALSLIVSIFSLKTHRYKFGPKLSKMERKSKEWNNINFIGATNKKIIKDIDDNVEEVNHIGKLLRYSIYLLAIGVLFLVLPGLLILVAALCSYSIN